MQADLLVYNSAQVLTVASPDGPKRGPDMRELDIIPHGGVAIRDGRVLLTGPSDELQANVRAERLFDAGGGVVMPGFVDPHTHLVWAGERAGEFEKRIAGATYGLSTSGIAGPDGGTPDKPVGLVCIGLATPRTAVGHRFVVSNFNRRMNKQVFAETALDILRRHLLGTETSSVNYNALLRKN